MTETERGPAGPEVTPQLTTADGEPLYTTEQAAALLGLKLPGVKAAIQRGRLAVVRLSPGRSFVTVGAIEAYRRDYLGKRGGYRPRKGAG
jgi:excisionase family DNA binding protein